MSATLHDARAAATGLPALLGPATVFAAAAAPPLAGARPPQQAGQGGDMSALLG